MAKRLDQKQVAADIVQYVGGQDNIVKVFHCMTCLRFILKDKSKVDVEAIQNIEFVFGTITSGDQFLIGLGEYLIPIYTAVRRQVPDAGKGKFGDGGRIYAVDSYGRMIAGHSENTTRVPLFKKKKAKA